MLNLYNLLNTEMGVGNENLCSDQQQLRSALALTIQVIENCKDGDTTVLLGNRFLCCPIPWANRKNRILVTWYGSSCAWTATIASLASKNLMLTTKKYIKKTDSIEWRGMRIFENFLWREKMYAVLDNFYVKSRVIVLTNTVIKWIRIENCFPEIIRKENICVIVYGRNGT